MFRTLLLLPIATLAYDNGKCDDIGDIGGVYVDWYDQDSCKGDPKSTTELKAGKCTHTGFQGNSLKIRSTKDYDVNISPSFGHDCNQVGSFCFLGPGGVQLTKDDKEACMDGWSRCSGRQCHYYLSDFFWKYGKCDLGKPTPPYGDHCDKDGKAKNSCCEVNEPND